MSFMVKLFWIVLGSLCGIGFLVIGLVGIPSKPVTVTKTISSERFTSQ